MTDQIWQRCRVDPVFFATEAFGVHLWKREIEVLRAIAQHKKVVIAAAHGVGKTFSASIIALWFLYHFPPAIVLTTAPTWRQVEGILWREIRERFRKSKFDFGGTILQSSLTIQDRWFARGLSTDDPDKFQGFHQQNLLVVIDEAAGVENEIWDSINGIVIGANNRILAIGNPTNPFGRYAEAFRNEGWHSIKMPCYEHPNVITGREMLPGMVTREWIEERKDDWGEDSPMFVSHVKGEFPKEGTDTLIPLSWIIAASEREVLQDSDKKVVGIDVGGMGDNETVMMGLFGNQAKLIDAYRGIPTMATVGKIINYQDQYKFSKQAIDDGALSGVVERLHEQGHYEAAGVNFGGAADDPEHFVNLRAQMFWELREAMNPNKDNPIAIEPDRKLMHQLSVLQTHPISSGKIQLKSKEELQKKTGGDLGRADALALAVYARKKVNMAPIIIEKDPIPRRRLGR